MLVHTARVRSVVLEKRNSQGSLPLATLFGLDGEALGWFHPLHVPITRRRRIFEHINDDRTACLRYGRPVVGAEGDGLFAPEEVLRISLKSELGSGRALGLRSFGESMGDNLQ